jgi:NAD(P)-dependent dehydrogenase (short-subunit alcohol dehydrogenase family)
MTARLANKVCIITGAASGLGATCAWLFAEEGASMVVVDRDEVGLAATADTISSAGGSAMPILADVTLEAAWERVVQSALAEYGRIDVLFNNAGIGSSGNILDTRPEDWDRTMGVNLRGVFLGCRAVLPAMLAQGHGVILATASDRGVVASWGSASYVASKHGVVGLMKSIAVDFAKHGIRANALCPGPIDTPMLRTPHPFRDATGKPDWVDDTLNHRIATPEQIASAALFLASDESSFMTGATLVVDDGLTAH